MKRTTLLVLGLFFSLGLLAQQPGGRGGFDPTGFQNRRDRRYLVDAETGEPLPFAAVKITHKMDAEIVTGGMTDDKVGSKSKRSPSDQTP